MRGPGFPRGGALDWRRFIGLYGRSVRAALRAKMQYKADFLMGCFLYALLSAMDFLMVAAILTRFPRLGGWDVYEIGVLYGMSSIAMGLYRTFAAELHEFERYLVQGEFDGLLLRPWPTLLTLLGRSVEPERLGAVLQGALILGIAAHRLMEAGTLSVFGLAYIAGASLMGTLIPFSLSLITAAVGFWVVRISDLQTFTMYAPVTASHYPLTVYPRWLRVLLTGVLPVGFINFVPVQYLLGKGAGPWVLWLSPLVVLGFGLVAYGCWRLGERHYQSTGT